MDLYDFFNTFITAVASYGDLATWANTNFARDVKIYANVDFDNAPDAEKDSPYIVFHSPGQRSNQERQPIEYTLGAWMVINRPGEATRAELNIEQPSALELILDFVTLTQKALVAALPDNNYIGFDVDTDTLGMVPEAHAYMDINIVDRQTSNIGTDPLRLI